MKESLVTWYETHHKKLIIIPILMFVLALGLLFMVQQQKGEFVQRDISLRGGVAMTVDTTQSINIDQLEQALVTQFDSVVVRELTTFGTEEQRGFVVEIAEQEEKALKQAVIDATGIALTEENISIEVVGASLGESFYKQMIRSVVFAFLFMAVAVLIAFRTLVPSFAVVFAALSDIVITLSVISVSGMRLSSSGIAALLLLIGYSIDTDILLTTRLLKSREGTIMEGVLSSMKTGLTMSVTTVIALTVALIVSTSLALQQMFLIIIIGLLIDVVVTYLMNAPILMMYVKKKQGGH